MARSAEKSIPKHANKLISMPGVSLPALLLFLGEGSPTKIDCRKKVGTFLLTTLLEDLVVVSTTFGRCVANPLGK